jgi:hypothetical protein
MKALNRQYIKALYVYVYTKRVTKRETRLARNHALFAVGIYQAFTASITRYTTRSASRSEGAATERGRAAATPRRACRVSLPRHALPLTQRAAKALHPYILPHHDHSRTESTTERPTPALHNTRLDGLTVCRVCFPKRADGTSRPTYRVRVCSPRAAAGTLPS